MVHFHSTLFKKWGCGEHMGNWSRHKQGKYEEMMSRYKQLLTYIKSAVTRNYSEKSINSILDYISTSKQASADFQEGHCLFELPCFGFLSVFVCYIVFCMLGQFEMSKPLSP